MQDAARQYLKHESREELIEAYFEAYERIPEGTEEDDEWPELED